MVSDKYVVFKNNTRTATAVRTAIVKMTVIGSKDRWKPRAILKSKVFRDWSIINIYLLDGNIFGAIFETAAHCFCGFSLQV